MNKKTLIVLFMILLSVVFALVASAAVSDPMDMSDHSKTNTVDQHAMEASDPHAMTGGINWYAIISLLGIIGVAGVFVSNTERLKKVNFLNYAPLKSLLKSRWYPLIFVLPTMIVFGILIVQLFFGSAETSTNFGSVMVWIFLWPLLPILFLVFGMPDVKSKRRGAEKSWDE